MTSLPAPPPRPKPDENALRLAALQTFLRRGLSLADAVKATNEHFKRLAREAKREAAA